MNHTTLAIVSIITYVFASLLQGGYLVGKINNYRPLYLALSLVAITSHASVLYALIETPMGQNMDWLVMLSFTCLLMNAFTLAFLFLPSIQNLCILTYPLSAMILGMALYYGGSEVILTKAKPNVLAHIFISFSAVSLLILASVQAILMGVQNHLLKHQRPSRLLQFLPPLQSMETLLFTLILGGMFFFSAAMISGLVFSFSFFHLSMLPKAILAFCGWVVLSLLLLGRRVFGWRGLTAIRWTLTGTVFTFFSYFGTKMLL